MNNDEKRLNKRHKEQRRLVRKQGRQRSKQLKKIRNEPPRGGGGILSGIKSLFSDSTKPDNKK